jgi:release factor glutamine methyltransferase
VTPVAEVLECGVASLSEFSESPQADGELLMAHVVEQSREWLVAHSEAMLAEQKIAAFIECCNRRRAGEPIAYILGTAWFYGREFLVDNRVLVPRPETEHLAEEAIRFIRGPMRVLDVGTGCGAIACTIAAQTPANVDATDSSRDAIDVARENARRLGVADRCCFYVGDLVEPVRDKRYDVVVANLPYVPTSDLPKAPDPASFEPRDALAGGPDGLMHYRRLLPQLRQLLDDESLILLEAAPPTIAQLAELAQTAFSSCTVGVCKDYAALGRYVRVSVVE